MPIRIRPALVPLIIALGLPALAHAQSPLGDPEYLKLGQQYTAWFFGGEADSLLAHMTPESREAAGGVAGVRQAMTDLGGRAGTERVMIEEKMTRRKGKPQYWRESMYSNVGDQTVVLRWVLDTDGQILGIGMNPKAAAPPPD